MLLSVVSKPSVSLKHTVAFYLSSSLILLFASRYIFICFPSMDSFFSAYCFKHHSPLFKTKTCMQFFSFETQSCFSMYNISASISDINFLVFLSICFITKSLMCYKNTQIFVSIIYINPLYLIRWNLVTFTPNRPSYLSFDVHFS